MIVAKVKGILKTVMDGGVTADGEELEAELAVLGQEATGSSDFANSSIQLSAVVFSFATFMMFLLDLVFNYDDDFLFVKGVLVMLSGSILSGFCSLSRHHYDLVRLAALFFTVLVAHLVMVDEVVDFTTGMMVPVGTVSPVSHFLSLSGTTTGYFSSVMSFMHIPLLRSRIVSRIALAVMACSAMELSTSRGSTASTVLVILYLTKVEYDESRSWSVATRYMALEATRDIAHRRSMLQGILPKSMVTALFLRFGTDDENCSEAPSAALLMTPHSLGTGVLLMKIEGFDSKMLLEGGDAVEAVSEAPFICPPSCSGRLNLLSELPENEVCRFCGGATTAPVNLPSPDETLRILADLLRQLLKARPLLYMVESLPGYVEIMTPPPDTTEPDVPSSLASLLEVATSMTAALSFIQGCAPPQSGGGGGGCVRTGKCDPAPTAPGSPRGSVSSHSRNTTGTADAEGCCPITISGGLHFSHNLTPALLSPGFRPQLYLLGESMRTAIWLRDTAAPGTLHISRPFKDAMDAGGDDYRFEWQPHEERRTPQHSQGGGFPWLVSGRRTPRKRRRGSLSSGPPPLHHQFATPPVAGVAGEGGIRRGSLTSLQLSSSGGIPSSTSTFRRRGSLPLTSLGAQVSQGGSGSPGGGGVVQQGVVQQSAPVVMALTMADGSHRRPPYDSMVNPSPFWGVAGAEAAAAAAMGEESESISRGNTPTFRGLSPLSRSTVSSPGPHSSPTAGVGRLATTRDNDASGEDTNSASSGDEDFAPPCSVPSISRRGETRVQVESSRSPASRRSPSTTPVSGCKGSPIHRRSVSRVGLGGSSSGVRPPRHGVASPLRTGGEEDSAPTEPMQHLDGPSSWDITFVPPQISRAVDVFLASVKNVRESSGPEAHFPGFKERHFLAGCGSSSFSSPATSRCNSFATSKPRVGTVGVKLSTDRKSSRLSKPHPHPPLSGGSDSGCGRGGEIELEEISTSFAPPPQTSSAPPKRVTEGHGFQGRRPSVFSSDSRSSPGQDQDPMAAAAAAARAAFGTSKSSSHQKKSLRGRLAAAGAATKKITIFCFQRLSKSLSKYLGNFVAPLVAPRVGSDTPPETLALIVGQARIIMGTYVVAVASMFIMNKEVVSRITTVYWLGCLGCLMVSHFLLIKGYVSTHSIPIMIFACLAPLSRVAAFRYWDDVGGEGHEVERSTMSHVGVFFYGFSIFIISLPRCLAFVWAALALACLVTFTLLLPARDTKTYNEELPTTVAPFAVWVCIAAFTCVNSMQALRRDVSLVRSRADLAVNSLLQLMSSRPTSIFSFSQVGEGSRKVRAEAPTAHSCVKAKATPIPTSLASSRGMTSMGGSESESVATSGECTGPVNLLAHCPLAFRNRQRRLLDGGSLSRARHSFSGSINGSLEPFSSGSLAHASTGSLAALGGVGASLMVDGEANDCSSSGGRDPSPVVNGSNTNQNPVAPPAINPELASGPVLFLKVLGPESSKRMGPSFAGENQILGAAGSAQRVAHSMAPMVVQRIQSGGVAQDSGCVLTARFLSHALGIVDRILAAHGCQRISGVREVMLLMAPAALTHSQSLTILAAVAQEITIALAAAGPAPAFSHLHKMELHTIEAGGYVKSDDEGEGELPTYGYGVERKTRSKNRNSGSHEPGVGAPPHLLGRRSTAPTLLSSMVESAAFHAAPANAHVAAVEAARRGSLALTARGGGGDMQVEIGVSEITLASTTPSPSTGRSAAELCGPPVTVVPPAEGREPMGQADGDPCLGQLEWSGRPLGGLGQQGASGLAIRSGFPGMGVPLSFELPLRTAPSPNAGLRSVAVLFTLGGLADAVPSPSALSAMVEQGDLISRYLRRICSFCGSSPRLSRGVSTGLLVIGHIPDHAAVTPPGCAAPEVFHGLPPPLHGVLTRFNFLDRETTRNSLTGATCSFAPLGGGVRTPGFSPPPMSPVLASTPAL